MFGCVLCVVRAQTEKAGNPQSQAGTCVRGNQHHLPEISLVIYH